MSLERAIYARCLELRLPQVHWGRVADAESSLPFVSLDGSADLLQEADTGEELVEDCTVRAHVFATGFEAARELLKRIEGGFVGQPLSLRGGTCCLADRGSQELMIDPDRDREGEEVWHGVIDLVFTVERLPGS